MFVKWIMVIIVTNLVLLLYFFFNVNQFQNLAGNRMKYHYDLCYRFTNSRGPSVKHKVRLYYLNLWCSS